MVGSTSPPPPPATQVTEDASRAPPLPGGAEEYVRDSIHSSLGLPVSDRSLRLKLLASEEQRHRLQDHVFSLEEDLRAAHRRIKLLKVQPPADPIHPSLPCLSVRSSTHPPVHSFPRPSPP